MDLPWLSKFVKAVHDSYKTANRVAESLFQPTIRPRHDRNQVALAASFFEYTLAKFHTPFLIKSNAGSPLRKEASSKRLSLRWEPLSI